MRRKLAAFAAAFFLSATVSACKTPSSSKVKADYEDPQPGRDESWTEARIVSFNDYANDLLTHSGNERKTYNEAALQLDESFKQAGITNYDPLSSYKVSLGNYGECFGENRSDYGIWWNSHRDAIKKQIEEVVFFVRDFHYLMLGRSKGAFSFREVVICPEAKIGSKMFLDGYKLFVGIPYSYGNYRPITNTGSDKVTLRNLWNEGYPLGIQDAGKGLMGKVRALFSKEEKAKIAMKALWNLFNPIAPARQGLRKLLQEHRGAAMAALDAFKSVPANALRADLIDLAYPGQNDHPDLGEISDETLVAAVKNWRCLLNDPAPISDVENDAMAMIQDNIKKTNVRNDVEAGLVAVVNHHDVGVLLAISTGSYNKYLDASIIQEFNVESRVRAGLVAVSTSDNISIDVRFLASGGKALRAGTFEKALRDARNGKESCGTTRSP